MGRVMTQAIGGAVLAGGKSRRMGVDKAALAFEGLPLRDHMAGLLRGAGADPVLTLGGAGGLADPVDVLGPAAGLFALIDYVTAKSQPEKWLLVPVDMPLLTPPLLQCLADSAAPAAYFADHPRCR